MRSFFLLTIPLFLAACTSPVLSPARFSDELPKDQDAYTELDLVRVSNPTQFPLDEVNCRNQLRLLAAQEGADLVVLETEERKPCFIRQEQSCLEMTGRSFRRQTP